VARALRTLDAEHRDVLVLRFYGGYSYEEIAKIVEAPLGTVKSRIFYAVKSCRETLQQKGVLR
jgi:RNA polymerase sigma-70 factor (ECF subfamily)